MFKTEFIEKECIPITITNSLNTKFSTVVDKKQYQLFDTEVMRLIKKIAGKKRKCAHVSEKIMHMQISIASKYNLCYYMHIYKTKL